MGLDLTYSADGREFHIRFSLPDWETLAELRSHLPEAVTTCVDTPDFGEPTTVALAPLRDAVETIQEFLRNQPELLPYSYQIKIEYLQIGDKRITLGGWTTGGVSGLQLPGDDDHRYVIEGGLNRCRLTRMAILPDGTGKVVEERDLRGEKELLTLNSGRIQIRKRRVKTSLREGLADIHDFLASLNSQEVTKIVG